MSPKVRTGLDRVRAGEVPRLAGKRIGLLAHAASVDATLTPALEVLESVGEVVTLFGPEHGFAGAAQDMVGVAKETERGRRVVSLYGEYAADLRPRPDAFDGLDVVVVDLQDVGARYYTYVWTTVFVLGAAQRAGVPVVILDRPNPIGGEVIEGRPQRTGFRSFVGLHEVSVRHGMTLGEMVRLAAARERVDEEAFEIVPMTGWRRAMFFDDTGLPWVLPSPNMPTLDTAIVYPGGCLIEGTTLSEGRGQTRPFEIWGGPGFRVDDVMAIEVPGAKLRRLQFTPTFQKHAGVMCPGVQVHVTDRARFRSYAAYLRWIAAGLPPADERMPWRTEEYEYDRRPAIDMLTGGPEYRQRVNRGEPIDDLLELEEQGAAEFAETRAPYLLY